MTTKKQITADLDKLVKRAAEVRVGAIKAAAAAPEGKSLDITKGEKVDAQVTEKDGKKGPKGSEFGSVTKEPTVSKNVAAVEKAVGHFEKGAGENTEGKSLDHTKGEKVDAQATSIDGKEGPKGSELGKVTKLPTTSKEQPFEAPAQKVAGAAPEGASLTVADAKGVDGVASAVDGKTGPKGSELGAITKKPTTSDEQPFEAPAQKVASAREFAAALRKEASAMLSPLDHFLVKAARSHADPKVKLAAEQMPDDQLAGASSDDLMSQLATGQIGEDDAKQILEEALQSGAITEDELKQAIQQAQSQGGAGPEGGAPADAGADAGAPPAGPDAPPAGPGADAGAPPVDAGAPPMGGDPKMAAAQEEQAYLTKIASDHADKIQAGEEFFHKLAELLVKSAEEAEEEKHEKAESPAHEKKEEAGAKLVDSMSGVNLKPADEAEKQALEAVKQELGLDDAKLAELAGAQVAAPQDKLAAAKVAYRQAFLSKIAALKK